MTVMPRAVDKAESAETQAKLISETLAAFAHGLEPAAIPAQVRERAKHLILDATGIAFASGRYEFAHKAMTALAGLGGEGSVPVIGLPARLPPRDAALINGILVHGLDFDDTHSGGIIHATASVWPTVMATSYMRGASGADLLTAYVAGGQRVPLSRHPGWLCVLEQGLGHQPYALEATRGELARTRHEAGRAGRVVRLAGRGFQGGFHASKVARRWRGKQRLEAAAMEAATAEVRR